MPARSLVALLPAACLLAALLCSTAASAQPRRLQQSSDCPLPQTVIDRLEFRSVNQPCASNPNRDAFCASCICAVGDAIVSGLQEQGLSLETLAAQAQQEAAGSDLTSVARQVLAACQLPVALRVVATSNVDSSSFNVLQTCNAEAVAQTCNFARQINDTVSRVAEGSLPAVGAANTTSLLPSNLTSPANATVANVTGDSGSMSGPAGTTTPVADEVAKPTPAQPPASSRNSAAARQAVRTIAGALLLSMLLCW